MPYNAHDDCGPVPLVETADEAEEPEELGAEEVERVDEAARQPIPEKHVGPPQSLASQLPSAPPANAAEGVKAASGKVVFAGRLSVTRETAPMIGSDGSSEEGATASRPRAQPRSQELRARIQACEREQRRLRAQYEVEVQHCADLREALEVREKDLASAKSPLQVQLQEVREALEMSQRTECGSVMRIEDDLAHCARLLENKDREIDDLERRLHGMQQCYQTFLRDGPPKDTVVEEALRAADKEMSELLSGVQRREQVIAGLNSDLRSALEYMISANVEAAGGAAADLTLEDFLPTSVREHLGLSEHGGTHLHILYKKYELIMSELQQKGASPNTKFHDVGAGIAQSDQTSTTSTKDAGVRHMTWHASDLDFSRRTSHSDMATSGGPYTPLEAGLEEIRPQPASPMLGGGLLSDPNMMNTASEALAQMMPSLTDIWAQEDPDEAAVVPLVAVVVDEEEDVWTIPADEASPSASSRAVVPAGGPRSASLEEEGRLLREAMAQELRKLAAALASTDDASEAQRAGRELRRAAAQGDEKAVKSWLLREAADPALDDKVFLGWTAWHVAAAYGQCGVLECLKEDMFNKATHHVLALDSRTRMGLPPLGVACLTGRVEAARSLIMGRAPVDVRDVRGNAPLLWAVIGEQARALVPLLLDAGADPEAVNCSGQRPDVLGLISGCSMATLTRPDLGTAAAVLPQGAAADGGAAASARHSTSSQEVSSERFGEAYHCIRTVGAEPPEEPGLLSYTLGMLKAPVRDAIGFAHNAKAKQLAQLSAAEVESGVWSEWVTNYTHAGLHAAVEVGRQNADPLLPHRNHQALVLTCERLLLFNARNWSLAQVIALSELSEITVSSFSASVLILRMHSLPDVVLDVATSVRSRLLDELQLAVGTVAAKWGGADFGGGLRIRHDCEPIVELLDERRKRAGTLAYIEAHVFLLLPYAPNSLLLAGGDTFFFGLLDVHQSSTAARGTLAGSAGLGWKWQTYFFILKSGSGEGRKLMWCQHPNDERALGSVHVGRLLAVQPLDTPQGEACLIIDYGGEERAHALTLRASSAQNREDWIVSLRTMQTGL